MGVLIEHPAINLPWLLEFVTLVKESRHEAPEKVFY